MIGLSGTAGRKMKRCDTLLVEADRGRWHGLFRVTPGLRTGSNPVALPTTVEEPASTKYLIRHTLARHGEVQRTHRRHLKILVSVVRFRPWPPESRVARANRVPLRLAQGRRFPEYAAPPATETAAGARRVDVSMDTSAPRAQSIVATTSLVPIADPGEA